MDTDSSMVFPTQDEVTEFMNSIIHLDKWGELTKSNVFRSTDGKKLESAKQLLIMESHEIVISAEEKMDLVVSLYFHSQL